MCHFQSSEVLRYRFAHVDVYELVPGGYLFFTDGPNWPIRPAAVRFLAFVFSALSLGCSS